MQQQNSYGEFLISASNRLCVLALSAIASTNSPPHFSNILMVAQGPWGKSLLAETFNEKLNSQGINSTKMSAGAFLELNQPDKDEARQQVLPFWQKQQVFIIDDVHLLKENKTAQHLLLQIFDARQQPDKYLLATSYVPLKDMELIEPLRSRLGGGLILHIEPPEYELMEKIAFKKAEKLGFPLNQELAARLIKAASSDPRLILGHLESASFLVEHLQLNPHDAVTRVCPDPVDISDAKVTIEEIITAVSESFAIKETDLTGHSKIREAAWPRRVAMYLAREMTPLTTTEIGSTLGGRDHSTIIHGLKKIQTELKNPARLKLVENIKRSIITGYKL